MEGDTFIVFQGVGRAFDHRDPGVQAVGLSEPSSGSQYFAPGYFAARQAGEVYCQSHAGLGLVDLGLVALQAADAGVAARIS